MKKIGVFGSTGSIGLHTLEVVAQFPEFFKVEALSCGKNISRLTTQIERFKPSYVCVQTQEDLRSLRCQFPEVQFFSEDQGLLEFAAIDSVAMWVQGIVGFAALRPTLKVIEKRKDVALANKEVLVVAGELMKRKIQEAAIQCIPVDSEHNALFQLLESVPKKNVASLILTASGGPFFRSSDLDLSKVTPQMAIKHPNWSMGAKISVDSATLMNKGLEFIEAHFLFDQPAEKIEVYIHPQSIVHGGVWLKDNTCLFHLSRPNMKGPIGHALFYPERLEEPIAKLSLSEFKNLEFLEPDLIRFPCLKMAQSCLSYKSSALVVLNAANEVAVDLFLKNQARFDEIPKIIETALNSHDAFSITDIESVFKLDTEVREQVIKRSRR